MVIGRARLPPSSDPWSGRRIVLDGAIILGRNTRRAVGPGVYHHSSRRSRAKPRLGTRLGVGTRTWTIEIPHFAKPSPLSEASPYLRFFSSFPAPQTRTYPLPSYAPLITLTTPS